MGKKEKKQLKKKGLHEEIAIPEGVAVSVNGPEVTAKGKYGECTKRLVYPGVEISANSGKLALGSKKSNKLLNRMIKTYKAHIKGMIKGASEGHRYALKVCASHFPMNVAVQGSQVIIKNFIGEKVPRVLDLVPGVKVSVDGTTINVESADKERASQTAASIEQITRRPGYDTRVFQDGIYITNKDGKEVK
jgi:large subunit ribosomal protein L6